MPGGYRPYLFIETDPDFIALQYDFCTRSRAFVANTGIYFKSIVDSISVYKIAVGLVAGCAGGLAFVAWFLFVSVTVLGKLCPYCMVIWASLDRKSVV